MKKLGPILASAAAAILIPHAAADVQPAPEDADQSALLILTDKEQQRRYFVLNNERVGQDTILERGLSDDAVGVVCHWKTARHINVETGELGFQMRSHHCAASAKPPAQWMGNARDDWDSINVSVREATFKIENGSTVDETITSRHNGHEEASIYRRLWDFNQNKVCLTFTQGQFYKGSFRTGVVMDQGCYEIPDNPYADKLRKKLHDQYKFY